jgi:hypothetical protein
MTREPELCVPPLRRIVGAMLYPRLKEPYLRSGRRRARELLECGHAGRWRRWGWEECDPRGFVLHPSGRIAWRVCQQCPLEPVLSEAERRIKYFGLP